MGNVVIRAKDNQRVKSPECACPYMLIKGDDRSRTADKVRRCTSCNYAFVHCCKVFVDFVDTDLDVNSPSIDEVYVSACHRKDHYGGIDSTKIPCRRQKEQQKEQKKQKLDAKG